MSLPTNDINSIWLENQNNLSTLRLTAESRRNTFLLTSVAFWDAKYRPNKCNLYAKGFRLNQMQYIWILQFFKICPSWKRDSHNAARPVQAHGINLTTVLWKHWVKFVNQPHQSWFSLDWQASLWLLEWWTVGERECQQGLAWLGCGNLCSFRCYKSGPYLTQSV